MFFLRVHLAESAVETVRQEQRVVAEAGVAARRPGNDAVDAGLEIGSVDGFQGREKEAVVVDLVRSNASATLGFLRDIRRTNVAITRAKRYLVVIGDGSTLARHEYYDQLLAAAQRDGVWRSTHEP